MFGIIKEKRAPGATFSSDLPKPKVGPRDVLIKVRATAICGTDLHIMNWTDYAASRFPVPMVFGHEFSGDIVEVGSEVTAFKAGDRIAGETHIPCNNCHQCKTDNRHICDNMKIIGVHAPGAFAEYAVIPQDCAYPLADNISYEVGAMLEPMGVAVHGLSVVDVLSKNILIYGCGPIGLMAVGAAKALGAKKIIAVDRTPAKLKVAQEIGADLTLNSRTDDVPAKVGQKLEGLGVDILVDVIGSREALISGFSSVENGGSVVLVGLPDGEIPFDFSKYIIYKELTVIGVTGRRMYQTWHECERILEMPGFSLEPVIGGIYLMAEFEKAFQALMGGAPGKMLLIP